MKDAEFYLPLLTDNSVPTLFYKMNDHNLLMYYSTCGGGWMYSEENEKGEQHVQEFIKNRLVEINS